MARPHRAALLQLPRDGGSWHNFHRGNDASSDFALARKALRIQMDAMAIDALHSNALHREHCRLDDRRTRATAVADLRTNADRAWSFAKSGCGKYLVHPDRL